MDLEYFKEHIEEELDGAEDYIKRAIEIRAMDSTWAKMFVEMSSAELQHASYLYKMFEDYYAIMQKEFREIPKYIQDMKTCVANMYSERTAAIKIMHDVYSR